MRSKLLALAVLLGGALVVARLVERRTRPDLVDEYGN